MTADRTRAALKAIAWRVLSRLRTPPTNPLRATARNRVATVTVTVRPVGDTADRPRRVGQWLSPTGTLILTKLGSDTLTRIDLAKRCGMECNPTFKALVRDLIDRGILSEPDEGRGVRAVMPGAKP